MAVRSGIPKAKNTGINMNAAPTPAMVRIVVKRNTSTAAIVSVIIIVNKDQVQNLHIVSRAVNTDRLPVDYPHV